MWRSVGTGRRGATRPIVKSDNTVSGCNSAPAPPRHTRRACHSIESLHRDVDLVRDRESWAAGKACFCALGGAWYVVRRMLVKIAVRHVPRVRAEDYCLKAEAN